MSNQQAQSRNIQRYHDDHDDSGRRTIALPLTDDDLYLLIEVIDCNVLPDGGEEKIAALRKCFLDARFTLAEVKGA